MSDMVRTNGLVNCDICIRLRVAGYERSESQMSIELSEQTGQFFAIFKRELFGSLIPLLVLRLHVEYLDDLANFVKTKLQGWLYTRNTYDIVVTSRKIEFRQLGA